MGWFKNIVTFGASGRIEKKIDEYDDYIYEYKCLYSDMEKKKEDLNKVLEILVKKKVEAIKSLKKIKKISENLKGKDRNPIFEEIENTEIRQNFYDVDETISTAEIAMNTGKGISAGIGTAVGTWALVSTYGAASTGTAIASLSGAAATNATLAWLGGGSLAAGGGGMAMGSVVLGGIVAIPALAITGIFSHLKANKKIKEIEEKIYEVREATYKIKDNISGMEFAEKRASEIIDSLEKGKEVFENELKKSYNNIYPIPFFSALFKSIKKNIFRKSYFTTNDLNEIKHIGEIAVSFSKIIDSKVF
ncbi:hypothetical protein [Fusobacterium necrophorum]|uniref:hypothetical protein n=1 Tax=Fusobacterium necrophorum TaxID=859 RepID=UPI0007883CF9|nr:hypothetical protein [Fusobacterium necrophorum]KYM38813.1 hypothetical protein A2U15_03075 [Fusobacterium necrophorum subsp. funduliforme]